MARNKPGWQRTASGRRRAAWPVLAMAGLLLAACQSSGPGARYYDMPLPADGGERSGPSLLDGVVEVQRPQVSGLYSERAMVYAAANSPQRRQYTSAYWIESPDRLIQRRLIDAWRRAGLADALVMPARRQRSDWRIAARLEGLHQVGPPDLPGGAPDGGAGADAPAGERRARLSLDLILLRQGADTIFLRETYRITVSAGQGLDAYARAAGRAVNRAATDFLEQIAGRLDQSGS